MKRQRVAMLLSIPGALLVLVGLACPQSSSPKPSFHIAGVVLREGTNAPVPRCHLDIHLEGPRRDRRHAAQDGMQRSTETDPQGHFSFDLPVEGQWQLSASAAGFRTQFYNEHEGFSSAVVVRSGLALPELVFLLEPDSAISGFVRDEAGEAVRNAALTLQLVAVPETSRARRLRATTDDRGHYEIDEVPQGNYKMSVQATPWYTKGALHSGSVAQQTIPAGPSLDVVYPVTWYPGVLESETAGEINLRSGEVAQVDFNLMPLPAAHLRVAGSSSHSNNPVAVPMIERVENGSPFGSVSSVSSVAGQMEFDGLSPGLYRVTNSQPDGHSTVAFLHVTAGATISLSGIDTAGTADVTVQFAGQDRTTRSQVVLTDVSTEAMFSSASGGFFGLRRRTLGVPDSQSEVERHIAAPAGRYQVSLVGDPDLYLTSISLKEKPLADHVVLLAGGPTTLTLRVARGRGSLSGCALLSGRPVSGAMVMLVPTTFGQPGSADLLRRDQSNTDGSYELQNIVPGDYILVAIDHGWRVNWHDPATLSRYLLHGVPLSLQPHGRPEQDIQAQEP